MEGRERYNVPSILVLYVPPLIRHRDMTAEGRRT